MTGTLQNYARKHMIAIDTLSFGFEATNQEFVDPTADETLKAGVVDEQDGVLVHGLFIEGARWDPTKSAIADPFPMEMWASKSKEANITRFTYLSD